MPTRRTPISPRHAHPRAFAACCITMGVLTTGCSDAPPPPACPPTRSGSLLVTADWLNESLTLFDTAPLADPACSVDDAIVRSLDLSGHPPGPLELEVTLQGQLVVALGPGFITGVSVSADRVPPGGGLLVVDADTGAVVHDITLPRAPMGLAITPDGRYALTADYGEPDVAGTTMSVIDLDRGEVVTSLAVGGRPEQVALDPSGTRGIVNAAADDVVLGFTLDGDTVTLSPGVDIGTDPSDVAFVGPHRAVAVSSLGLSYSLLDMSDPLLPTVLDTFGTPSGIPYGITAIAGTSQVLVTTALTEATLIHADVANDMEVVLAEIPLGGSPLALVAVHDPASGLVFVPQPNDQRLAIVDLTSHAVRAITWLTDVGPTYAALRPRR